MFGHWAQTTHTGACWHQSVRWSRLFQMPTPLHVSDRNADAPCSETGPRLELSQLYTNAKDAQLEAGRIRSGPLACATHSAFAYTTRLGAGIDKAPREFEKAHQTSSGGQLADNLA